MRARLLSLTVLGGLLIAAPASAQTAVDWSGFYAGLGIGGGVGTVTDFYDLSDTFTFSIAGLAVDGRIGADMMSGNMVVGVVVDVGGGTFSGSGSCFLPTCGGSGTEPTVLLQRLATIGGRLGYAFDDTMIYGGAGVAMAWAFADDPVQGGNDAHYHRGVVVSAGAEKMVVENLSVFAEGELGLFEPIDYALVTDPDRFSFTTGTVRVGANFHF